MRPQAHKVLDDRMIKKPNNFIDQLAHIYSHGITCGKICI